MVMVASLFQIQFEKALEKRLQELTTEVMAEAINWPRKGRKHRQKVVLVTWKMSYNLIRFFEELSAVSSFYLFSSAICRIHCTSVQDVKMWEGKYLSLMHLPVSSWPIFCSCHYSGLL